MAWHGRFRLPTFLPGFVNIWRAGSGPPAAPAVAGAAGNLEPGRREELAALTAGPATASVGLMYLLLPWGTDIRGVNSASGSDVIECPAGSGSMYTCWCVKPSATGFANQHLVAELYQANPWVPPALAPTVTDVSPDYDCVVGGETVTITGTNFVGVSAVDFGVVPASTFSVVGPTSIVAVDPTETSGTVDVTVTTAAGTSATTSADLFTFQVAPTVTLVSPATDTTAGGTSITITGTDFLGASGVLFGAVPATSITVVSQNELTCLDPAQSAGIVDVTVTTACGTSATTSADEFAYTMVCPHLPSYVMQLNSVLIAGSPGLFDLGLSPGTTTGSTIIVTFVLMDGATVITPPSGAWITLNGSSFAAGAAQIVQFALLSAAATSSINGWTNSAPCTGPVSVIEIMSTGVGSIDDNPAVAVGTGIGAISNLATVSDACDGAITAIGVNANAVYPAAFDNGVIVSNYSNGFVSLTMGFFAPTGTGPFNNGGVLSSSADWSAAITAILES